MSRGSRLKLWHLVAVVAFAALVFALSTIVMPTDNPIAFGLTCSYFLVALLLLAFASLKIVPPLWLGTYRILVGCFPKRMGVGALLMAPMIVIMPILVSALTVTALVTAFLLPLPLLGLRGLVLAGR